MHFKPSPSGGRGAGYSGIWTDVCVFSVDNGKVTMQLAEPVCVKKTNNKLIGF